ncbi:MAG: hypothetical protein MPJ25_08945 [Pirellulales bacterium]|nr:hypothetical protein [Pirellulales bacterium]
MARYTDSVTLSLDTRKKGYSEDFLAEVDSFLEGIGLINMSSYDDSDELYKTYEYSRRNTLISNEELVKEVKSEFPELKSNSFAEEGETQGVDADNEMFYSKGVVFQL